MGQVQSGVADDENGHITSPTSVDHSSIPHQPSMDFLIAEAVAYGSDGNESLDGQAQKALECPCIADLRSGPCGTPFSEAFVCFLKSTAEEKGSDCVHPFVSLQECIKAHPDAFSKDILAEDEEVKKDEEAAKVHRIIPPVWSVEESKSRRRKLDPKLNIVFLWNEEEHNLKEWRRT